MYTGLRTTGDHDIRIAKGNKAGGVPNRVGAGGTGRGGGVIGALKAILHGNVAGGEIDEDLGDKQRRDFLVTLPIVLAFPRPS